MSLVLYRLGLAVGRHRVLVIVAWVVILLALLGAGRAFGSAYDDDYSIPGTESQIGQNVIADRFGSHASGAQAQVLYRVDHGSISGDATHAVVAASLRRIAAVGGVASVTTADDLRIDRAGDAALATVQFDADHPDAGVTDAVRSAATVHSAGVTSTIGGNAFTSPRTGDDRATELIGVLIALGVLIVSFGSFLAAGMPILTAVIGVAITTGGLGLLSLLTTVPTTSPSFASMLGLAVGIDYALFILSRHRAQLAEGLAPRESMARALGTSGSAVVFAGLTVVVSLAGLGVAGIPVLSLLGLSGAGAVLVAVLVALTLLPAVALLFGARLTPRPRRRGPRRAPARRPGLAQRWVRLVTRMPVVTIIAVTVALGALSIPAFSLVLALPDSSTKPLDDPARQNYDAIAQTFGAGYNAPLLVTADILASTHPTSTVDDLKTALSKLPGVVAVTTATPNSEADTALFRLIPEGGQNDPATVDLVHRLRADAPSLEGRYGVADLRVTGSTAVNIDVSERLQSALLPFGLTVVGLCVVLLAIVFRSIAVPLKAAAGYVLSVGAAFGALVAVFEWGWLPGIRGGDAAGPVVSFLPILVMGVLFGLAMDYEMFLVSRMREHYARTGDARESVYAGFRHSAPVVTAAALIMVSVFAAFVPSGNTTIKPIAFALAVGVFADAFLVRMTLVPAVLVLLGDRAWWLPRPLDRVLPMMDVEGETLLRSVHARRDVAAGPPVLELRALAVHPGDEPIDLTLDAGSIGVIPVRDADAARVIAMAVTGRARVTQGEVRVRGLVMPEEAERARQEAVVVARDIVPDGVLARAWARDRLRLLGRRGRRLREDLDRIARVAGDLDRPTSDLSADERRLLAGAVALASGARLLVLPDAEDGPLAALLVRHGATVLMIVDRVRGSEDRRALEVASR